MYFNTSLPQVHSQGGQSYYNNELDIINISNLVERNSIDYYHQLFHLLSHVSVHENRLNRDTVRRFKFSELTQLLSKSDNMILYAIEEITAELTAQQLLLHYQIRFTKKDIKAYIDMFKQYVTVSGYKTAVHDSQIAFNYLLTYNLVELYI